MKKIYVYNTDTNLVDNIDKVHITDIHTVPNGSCSLIVCDCLDSLVFADRLTAIQDIFKKIALAGSVTFRFINLKLFAKYISTDKLDIVQINNILYSCNSMYDDAMLDSILSSYGNFTIKENIYNGLIRQITLERKV